MAGASMFDPVEGVPERAVSMLPPPDEPESRVPTTGSGTSV
jgi:hypothetical protein